MDILDSHIKTLDRDGVVIVNNAVSGELKYLQHRYSSGWSEILDNFSTLKWNKIKFNSDCQINTGFIGKDLYNGHLKAEYKSTGIIDMTNSRYDFTYNLEHVKIQSNYIKNIMKNTLKNEENSDVGGLPILKNIDYPNQSHRSNYNRNGKWHRDAYSLFDNETLDITLPPFYYTILVPLFTMQATNGRNTEFIPGSHRFNLA